jgi:hypothetical protein
VPTIVDAAIAVTRRDIGLLFTICLLQNRIGARRGARGGAVVTKA